MAEPSCLLCAQNCRRIHGEACSAGASFPGFALVVTRSCLDEDYLRVPDGFGDALRKMLEEAWEKEGGHLYLEGPSGRRWPVAACEASRALVQGWLAFAIDNRLNVGDILFFKTVESLVLAVSIFDCEGSAKLPVRIEQQAFEQPCQQQRQFRRLCKASDHLGRRVYSKGEAAPDNCKPEAEKGNDVPRWSPLGQEQVQPVSSAEKRACKPKKLEFESDSEEWVEYLVPVPEAIDTDEVQEVAPPVTLREVIDLDELEEVAPRVAAREVIDLDEIEEAAPPTRPVKQESALATVGIGSRAAPSRSGLATRPVKVKREAIAAAVGRGAAPSWIFLGRGTTPRAPSGPEKQLKNEPAGWRNCNAYAEDSKRNHEHKRKQPEENEGKAQDHLPVLQGKRANSVAYPVSGMGGNSSNVKLVRNVSSDYQSLRRPVSHEEVAAAWQRAKAKLKECQHPAFLLRMVRSHVIRGFWLGLPSKFCRKYIGENVSKWGWLFDSRGRMQEVKYIGRRLRTAGPGLSAGWGGFARKRTLDLDDVCVFELVDRTNFVMHVHIFRVVELDDSDLLCKHKRPSSRKVPMIKT